MKESRMIYVLARLLLIIASVETAFVFLVFVAFYPPVMLLVAVLLIAGRMGQRSLWSHGTARWADERDLSKAGMIDAMTGLGVGRLFAKGRVPSPGLPLILNPHIDSRAACEHYWKSVTVRRRESPLVSLNKTPHTAVFGPTGMGKGTSFIVPWLLRTDESAVVLDYKGENAAITARHRTEAYGHRVVLLDPFHVVTQTPDSLNPLDFIGPDSPFCLDNCRDLAEQLVVRNPEEREQHWNDGSEMFIGGGCVAVVKHGSAEDRSLQTVRDIVTNPDNIPKLIQVLAESEGMLPRLGGQLAFFKDKELASVMTTANRHLRFLDTPAISACTRTSSFDPSELQTGKMTVYCILPPEHMRAQAPLIRMWIGTLMHSVVRGGLQSEKSPFHPR